MRDERRGPDRRVDDDVRRNRRLLVALYALVCLNWLHDLSTSVEMFDWLDGRSQGFLSSEVEHEVTVLGPLIAMVFVPIIVKWIDVRFGRRKRGGE